jgi:hypothetical protein
MSATHHVVDSEVFHSMIAFLEASYPVVWKTMEVEMVREKLWI